jgi:hypothetical protein
MDNRNYDGILWSQDAYGYWVNRKHGKQHTYVYKKLTGYEVFPWQVVHHMDGNRSNNTAENLVCMTKSDHDYLHSKLESTRIRKSESCSGEKNGFYHKNHTEETRQVMSERAIIDRRKAGIRSQNKSGFKGVSKMRDKWQTHCNKNYIGCFNTPEAAALAYDEAAKKYFGDDCFLNFTQDNLRDCIAST